VNRAFKLCSLRVLLGSAKTLDPGLRPLLSGISLKQSAETVADSSDSGSNPERQLTTGACNMFSICRFHALIQAIPRPWFDQLVASHQTKRLGRSSRCWQQLLSMIFVQLTGLSSLRTAQAGFNRQRIHHYHWGCSSLRRSTLAEANQCGNPALFAELASWLMTQTHRRLRQETQDLLYLLDSSSVTLRGYGFDEWTQAHRTCHTQGLKLHVLYDAHLQIPLKHSITMPTVNDLTEGTRLPLQAGARYVFDKAYCDYQWWHQIDQAGATFVTRFKRNAGLRQVSSQPIAPADADIIVADEWVTFKHAHSRAGHSHEYQRPLRRISVARPNRPHLVLATNDMASPARAIAEDYKARWGIELFFKWVKQHLNIRRFLGRSENAVRIQILTALITHLLLALYHRNQGSHESLWLFLAELRCSLFDRGHPEIRPHPPPRHLTIES
jgi:IS4 transposase